jgi:hypothetical protein
MPVIPALGGMFKAMSYTVRPSQKTKKGEREGYNLKTYYR